MPTAISLPFFMPRRSKFSKVTKKREKRQEKTNKLVRSIIKNEGFALKNIDKRQKNAYKFVSLNKSF